MSRKLTSTIQSPGGQYLIGLFINCLFLLILINHDVSYQNLQVPEGVYSDNLWKGTDVLTYVGPARNFLDHGVFGRGSIPDYHRTIGYPLFLSLFIVLGGSNWLIFTLFAQAALFALMYPLLSKITRIMFPTTNDNASLDNLTICVFLFFIFSGTFIASMPILMTDTFFALFLTLGIWSGLKSIIKHRYFFLIVHILSIGIAAQVRPVLALFPVINCLLLFSVVNTSNHVKNSKPFQFIFISFFFLLLFCNLPSVRNYINHGFLVPSDVLSNNMLDYLGKNVLVNVDRVDRYNLVRDIVEKTLDPSEKMHLQKEYALEIYKDYPLATVTQILRNAMGIMGRAHWTIAANFWGYNFKDNISSAHMPKQKSFGVLLVEICFNFVYLIVLLLFLSFLIRALRSTNAMFFLSLALLIAYLLLPTFMVNAAGSRFRLPVEGLIVIMAARESQYYFRRIKEKLLLSPFPEWQLPRILPGRTPK